MGIGTHRNREMVPPAEKKTLLEKTWGHLKLLVLEEVSMISPNLYNMLLYRAFHGRREQCVVQEADYLTRACAFGRLPIVIYLGDFLQLKPTGSGLSLLSDLRALEPTAGAGAPPAEHQQAMKFFCATPYCFELKASYRFKDPELAGKSGMKLASDAGVADVAPGATFVPNEDGYLFSLPDGVHSRI
mgnify:CR=1 FL=1